MSKRNYKIRLTNSKNKKFNFFTVKEYSFAEAVAKAYVKRNKYDDYGAWRVTEIIEE